MSKLSKNIEKLEEIIQKVESTINQSAIDRVELWSAQSEILSAQTVLEKLNTTIEDAISRAEWVWGIKE